MYKLVVMIRYLQVQAYWFLIFGGFWWVIILGAADITFSSNTTLTQDLRLSASQRALITANATIDGAGYFGQCPITKDQVIVVSAGVAATLQNLLLRDFANTHLSLGSGSSIIFGNNTTVQTLVDQVLTNTLNFAGNSTLMGVRNVIDLAGGGSVIVKPGGCLTIANVSLVNVASSNLYCVDNTGSIKFENVTISIPNTWAWSHGSFSIAKNVELFDGIFVYASGLTSTVSANSRLILSNNLTFSYDPAILSGQSVASKLGLVFTNTTSWLVLNGCNLYVTNTGMQLLKGSLEVIGQNNLYSDALASASQGLLLGDGSIYANDFIAKKFNANLAGITVRKGLLTYQNVEISPGPPICYGDGILLQHKTYGVYIRPTVPIIYDSSQLIWTLYATSSKPSSNNLGYFFVEPLDSSYRFGAPGVVGTVVKSGDNIRLESVYGQNIKGYNEAFCMWFKHDGGTPPYSPLIAHGGAGASFIFSCGPGNFNWPGAGYKIYKLGANVGDPIAQGDPIYLVSWIFPESSYSSLWLGSYNQSYQDGFAVFVYQKDTNYTTPPDNFTTNYIWTISDIQPALYQNSQVVKDVGAVNPSIFNTSYLPAASTYQF